jgi:hypothetical protein
LTNIVEKSLSGPGEIRVGIAIGPEDFSYAACIFHEPVFILILDVDRSTAKLFLDALANMESYDSKLYLDGIAFFSRQTNTKNPFKPFLGGKFISIV